ncbi:glutamate receptor 2.8-like [Elaeis guineensis]|uniref:glutamate receptor 2.8-like n=1 Tax=Elaeis guineensis var. tenera TaxID=51953 RepID=UPI003C6D0FA2
MSRISINMALSDFYAAHPNSTTSVLLLPRYSAGDVISTAAAALDLMINHEVHAVLGPQRSVEASFVAELATKARVPVVSSSATSPLFVPSQTPYFIRAAQSTPRRLVPSPPSCRPSGGAASSLPYRCALPTYASDDRISVELYKLKTEQTRVFVVHMTSTFARRLFARAENAGMMAEGYVWIATEGFTCLLPSFEPAVVLDTMQGVLGVRPFVRPSEALRDFQRRWRREFWKENPNYTGTDAAEVNNFGVWAYDAAWAVAMAARASVRSARNSSHRETLLEAISQTEFDGLGGKFRLVKGALNVSAYEIVNVIGEKATRIGFWTARYGLTRGLNWSSESPYSATRDGLGPVIWPGESTSGAGKGGRHPRAGGSYGSLVPGPVEPGFHSFLNVEKDPVSNETKASGYVIDVFEAAVRQLPYALPFEYVPENAKGKRAGDYNALVQEVSNQDDRSNSAWIFLKPLTAELWLVSAAFFVFTGIVVWALEHRINEEFRGPWNHQIGTVFYFSFSTLVFAHRENVVSNFSRAVVIIWVFVVLILQSSYTASLTSMLTVQRFKPIVTDYKELIDRGEYVGYLKDSFVKDVLLKWGFHESKLRPYKSPNNMRTHWQKEAKMEV